MKWVTAEEVIFIQSIILKETGGLQGVRDLPALESAIAAPLQTFGGNDLFRTEVEKVARLGYGVASNHAFVDGNKRIGAALVYLVLKWNGYRLALKKDELADMFIGIADGKKSEQDLLSWIKNHLG